MVCDQIVCRGLRCSLGSILFRVLEYCHPYGGSASNRDRESASDLHPKEVMKLGHRSETVRSQAHLTRGLSNICSNSFLTTLVLAITAKFLLPMCTQRPQLAIIWYSFLSLRDVTVTDIGALNCLKV